jgi:hypothetical protein
VENMVELREMEVVKKVVRERTFGKVVELNWLNDETGMKMESGGHEDEF